MSGLQAIQIQLKQTVILFCLFLTSCFRGSKPNSTGKSPACKYEFINLRKQVIQIMKNVDAGLEPEVNLEQCVGYCQKMDSFPFSSCEIIDNGEVLKLTKEQLMETCREF